MNLCNECKKYIEKFAWLSQVMGDGYCDKHGRFPFYYEPLKEYCIECAMEQNICQRCGKVI
jgi:hypothetical protein